MGNLTETEVRNVKSQTKRYLLSDGNKLSLQISTTGAKSWLIRYRRPFTKKTANMSLGEYPAITLKQARKQRDEINELLAKNIDPQDYREKIKIQNEEEINNTFLVYANKWRTHKLETVKPDTINRSYKILERHFLPKLGKMPISKITPVMVVKVLEPLKASGSLETLKKLMCSVNQIMLRAKIEGIIIHNPLLDLTKNYQSPQTQNHLTIAPQELPILMCNIINSNVTKVTRCLFEWQLRTLTRPGEAAKTKWEDIDLSTMLWTIPASQMKMKREHIIPITVQMNVILSVARSLNVGDSEYVFQSRINKKDHVNTQTVNKALKNMGYGGKLVSHGLRALASTSMNEKGFDRDIIESALAHADRDSIRQVYNRAQYIEQKRELLCWWSDAIDQASIVQNTISNI